MISSQKFFLLHFRSSSVPKEIKFLSNSSNLPIFRSYFRENRYSQFIIFDSIFHTNESLISHRSFHFISSPFQLFPQSWNQISMLLIPRWRYTWNIKQEKRKERSGVIQRSPKEEEEGGRPRPRLIPPL